MYYLWICILPVISCTIGTILNSLVMSIYSKDWRQKKSLNVCDQIILSMVITGTGLQGVITLDFFIMYMQEHVELPLEVFFCFCVVLVYFPIEATFWQLAVLSTYYCVKLLNVTFPFFRWVRRLIMGSSSHLLITCATVCLAINVPYVWVMHLEKSQNVTGGTRRAPFVLHINRHYGVFNIILGCCLPFAITFTCIVLSVGSLMRHVWRIWTNVPQCRSPSKLGGHIRAASTMVLCMVLDLSFIVSVINVLSSPLNSGGVLESMIWVILSFYPTILSVILIIGNPQLKSRIVEMCASSS